MFLQFNDILCVPFCPVLAWPVWVARKAGLIDQLGRLIRRGEEEIEEERRRGERERERESERGSRGGGGGVLEKTKIKPERERIGRKLEQ